MKFTRDPVTQYPAVKIADQLVILKKEAGEPEKIMNQPAQEIVECAI